MQLLSYLQPPSPLLLTIHILVVRVLARLCGFLSTKKKGAGEKRRLGPFAFESVATAYTYLLPERRRS